MIALFIALFIGADIAITLLAFWFGGFILRHSSGYKPSEFSAIVIIICLWIFVAGAWILTLPLLMA